MKGSLMDVGYIVTNHHSRTKEPLIYAKTVPNTAAKIATDMVIKWGMVMACADGEDSAGRAKTKIMPIEEVVERACNAAQLLIEEFDKREWRIVLPEPQVIGE